MIINLKRSNRHKNCFIGAGLLLLFGFMFIPGVQARERGNAWLKKMLHAGKIDFLHFTSIDQSDFHGLRGYASSYLAPEGRRPEKPNNLNLDTDYTEYDQMLDDFEDMYFPGNVFSNPRTAWVEGVRGDGIGEVLIVKLDIRQPVKIWNGFGKNVRLFKANNRVKKARIYLLKASGIIGDQYRYKDIEVLSSHTVILKDKNGFQNLKLPALPQILEKALDQKLKELKQSGYAHRYGMFVAIEILSVYKGAKYSDTCISVVSN